MSEYWKAYWENHVEGVSSEDPFRQVLRVQSKKPISSELFLRTVAYVVEKLELRVHHRVLDLCCGNGLVSAHVALRCARLVGVDFSHKLVEGFRSRVPGNVNAIVADARRVAFAPGYFERILIAAALQHFSESEVIALLRAQARWLQPSGLVLITDIPDRQRIWSFYDNDEREDAYFENRMRGTPILGTWFEREWLKKLARHCGFREAWALDQPDDFFYAHYRFDLVCRK